MGCHNTVVPDTVPQYRSSGSGGVPPGSSEPLQWKPRISDYHGDLRAIRFSSLTALFAAVDLFHSDLELKGVPRMPIGDDTLFMPSEAIDILRRKGMEFTEMATANPRDFTAKEMSAIRRRAQLHPSKPA